MTHLFSARRRSLTAVTATATVLGLVAAGCGSSSQGSQASKAVNPNHAEVSPSGDIPDNQAFVAYTAPGGYSVKTPEGWSRTTSAGATSFTDKLNAIRIETARASAAPTVARVKSTDIPKLASTVKGFKLTSVGQVHRRAGTAVRIAYTGEGAPDTVTGKVSHNAIERYIFFHNGREAVLTLTAPRGADNVDPWKIVTDSVRWTP
jgi:hypothetical protein